MVVYFGSELGGQGSDQYERKLLQGSRTRLGVPEKRVGQSVISTSPSFPVRKIIGTEMKRCVRLLSSSPCLLPPRTFMASGAFIKWLIYIRPSIRRLWVRCHRAINETDATTCKQYARNTLLVRFGVTLQAKNNLIGNF